MIIHPRNTQQSHTSQPADSGYQVESKEEILNAGAELGPGVKDDCFASFKTTGGELPLPLESMIHESHYYETPQDTNLHSRTANGSSPQSTFLQSILYGDK